MVGSKARTGCVQGLQVLGHISGRMGGQCRARGLSRRGRTTSVQLAAAVSSRGRARRRQSGKGRQRMQQQWMQRRRQAGGVTGRRLHRPSSCSPARQVQTAPPRQQVLQATVHTLRSGLVGCRPSAPRPYTCPAACPGGLLTGPGSPQWVVRRPLSRSPRSPQPQMRPTPSAVSAAKVPAAAAVVLGHTTLPTHCARRTAAGSLLLHAPFPQPPPTPPPSPEQPLSPPLLHRTLPTCLGRRTTRPRPHPSLPPPPLPHPQLLQRS